MEPPPERRSSFRSNVDLRLQQSFLALGNSIQCCVCEHRHSLTFCGRRVVSRAKRQYTEEVVVCPCQVRALRSWFGEDLHLSQVMSSSTIRWAGEILMKSGEATPIPQLKVNSLTRFEQLTPNTSFVASRSVV